MGPARRVGSRTSALAAAVGALPALAVLAAGCGWSDAGDSSIDIADGTRVTLDFAGDELAGTAPCNSFGATFSLHGDDDETIDIGDVRTTLRGCEESLMRSDDRFLAALAAVDTVDVDLDDDRLVLRNARGDRLSFTVRDTDD